MTYTPPEPTRLIDIDFRLRQVQQILQGIGALDNAVLQDLAVQVGGLAVEIAEVQQSLSGLNVSVDLSPVTTRLTTIQQAIAAISLSVDLSPVLSAISALHTTANTIAGYTDTVEGSLATVLTNQGSQAALLNTIAGYTDTVETSLASVLTNQGGHTSQLSLIAGYTDTVETSLASVLANQTTILSKLDQILSGGSGGSAPSANGQAYTASQSSVFVSGGGVSIQGTYTNLTDNNITTGAGTNNSSSGEWIKASFSVPVAVASVTVRGGSIPGWGRVAAYLNGAKIQYSTNNSTWADVATVSGVTESSDGTVATPVTFTLSSPITAQYWRLWMANYLATTEFRFQ